MRRLREVLDERVQQLRLLRGRLRTATSYREWRALARQIDHLDESRLGGRCSIKEEKLYDKKLLRQKLRHLEHVREGGNIREMMFNLRSDLIRNVANIAKSPLHEYTYSVPPTIREWTQEVQTQLSTLADWPEAGVSNDEKLGFFRDVRHAYGRTALLLSGGGGLGSFHIGVIKALFEHRMLPRVLAGSSAGSIVAGIICTRTDDELQLMFDHLENFDMSFFNNNRPVEFVHHFLARGTLQDMAFLQRKLQQLVGSYTFLEAYDRTGRILNVSVCPADTNEPPRLLNYLTAPQAIIWSAVAASSAFPGLFQPQDILARNARGEEVPFNSAAGGGGTRGGGAAAIAAAAAAAAGAAAAGSGSGAGRWRDGSLELDLPTFLLAEMFNCNHFIVSQCNPHIVPLLNFKKTLSRKWANLLELELRHRCLQAQWLLSDVIPTKWLTLFTQPWEGDVTFVLPSALWNLGKSITNPTSDDLIRATKLGELHVWEKLSAIEANCAVEATLDACLARLANKARERPLAGLSARVPSWLCMGAVGQRVVASWGNPLQASSSALWGPGGWRVTAGSGGALDTAAAAGGGAGSSGALTGLGTSPGAGGVQQAANHRHEAMAAAAAAAMVGQQRLQFYHPAHLGGSFGVLSAGSSGALLGTSAGAAAAFQGVHTIHESMADHAFPRVMSWGNGGGGGDRLADSVSDFPADNIGPWGAAGGAPHRRHHRHHHHHDPDERHRAGGAGGEGEGAADGTPRSSLDGDASPGAGGGSGPDRRDSIGSSFGTPRSTTSGGSSSSGGSGSSSGGFPEPSAIISAVDCCDRTAALDLWSSLLPLGRASMALEAVAEGEALDFIAT